MQQGGPETENKDYSTNINATNKRGNIGSEYYYQIIGSEDGTVWGDNIFTDDSNIAKAACFSREMPIRGKINCWN